MTNEKSDTNPLTNSLQQLLYQGQSGAPAPAETTTSEETTTPAEPKAAGWWALQADPSNSTSLTMLITLDTAQTQEGSLSFYSSRLSVDDVQSLYQWLALQMSRQTADSGKKATG